MHRILVLAFALPLAGCTTFAANQGPGCAAGTIVGATAGGLAGSAIGAGSGQLAAIGAGVALGGAAGYAVTPACRRNEVVLIESLK